MATYDLIAGLPLEIESVELEAREQQYGEFLRRTTIIHLHGGGHEGVGEDVTYDPELHQPFQAMAGSLSFAGSHTIDSFSELVGGIDLFGGPIDREVYRNYRQWAVESAALDLALRQAGKSFPEVLGREARPVTFVCSLRLGEPPTLEPIRKRLAIQTDLKFKLDAQSAWTEELFAELVELGVVNSIDFKGAYEGTPVDQPADPLLYQRVVDAFPEAWLEDPKLDEDTSRILEPHRDRVTWDAVIHDVADVERLPFPPKMVNVKPSRSGPWRTLFGLYDYLAEHDIQAYGGGQSELGPGRGQIQALASVFHPDTPNDIAPSPYNLPDPPAGLPGSPLPAKPSNTGFRWSD